MVSDLGENFRCPRSLCQSISKGGHLSCTFPVLFCWHIIIGIENDRKNSDDDWNTRPHTLSSPSQTLSSFSTVTVVLIPLQETLSLKGRMHGDTFLSNINFKIYCTSDVNYLHHNFAAISNKRVKICLSYRKHIAYRR